MTDQDVAFASPAFEMPQPVVDKILSSARRDGNLWIEPFILQVFCHDIEDQVIRAAEIKPGQPIKAEEVIVADDFDGALRGYYEEQVHKAAKDGNVKESIVREWFRDCLIDPTARIRTPFVATVDQQTNDLAGKTGMNFKALGALERGFLVRREQHAGATHYELVHDRLVAPIVKCNEAWLEKSPDLVGRAYRWQTHHNPNDLLRAEEVTALTARFELGEEKFTELEKQLWQASKELLRREQVQLAEQKTLQLQLEAVKQLQEREREKHQNELEQAKLEKDLILMDEGRKDSDRKLGEQKRWLRLMQTLFCLSMASLAFLFLGLWSVFDSWKRAEKARSVVNWIYYTSSVSRAKEKWRERDPSIAWDALKLAIQSSDKDVRGWEVALLEAEFRGGWHRWPDDEGDKTTSWTGWRRTITQVACQPASSLIAVGVVNAWGNASGNTDILFLFDPRPTSDLNPKPFSVPDKEDLNVNVRCLAWLNQTTLISGGADGQVRIWDTETNQQVGKGNLNSDKGTSNENREILCLSVIPGKQIFVSGDSLGDVVSWTWQTNQLASQRLGSHRDDKKEKTEAEEEFSSAVNAIACHPDGRQVVSAGNDRRFKLWNIEQTESTRPMSDQVSDGVVRALAFSSEGTLLASGDDRGRVRVWNFEDFEKQEQPKNICQHHGTVSSIAWAGLGVSGKPSETGRWLSAGRDGSVQLSDNDQSTLLFGGTTEQRSISLSDPIDGRRYVVCADDAKLVRGELTVPQGNDVKPKKKYPDKYYSAATSQNGRWVVRGGYGIQKTNKDATNKDAKPGGKVEVIERASADAPVKILATGEIENDSPVYGVAIGGRRDQIVVSCTRNGEIQVWKREESTLIPQKTLKLGQQKDSSWSGIEQELRALAVAIHPSGQWLLCSRSDGVIERLKLRGSSSKSEKWFPLINPKNSIRYDLNFSVASPDCAVNCMAFDHDGKTLLTGDKSGRILMWSVTDEGLHTPMWVGNYDTSEVWSIAFSHDEKRILSGNKNGKVRIWRIPTEDLPSADPKISIFDNNIARPLKDPLWETQLPEINELVGIATSSSFEEKANSNGNDKTYVTLHCFLSDGTQKDYKSVGIENKPNKK